jgi:hypothetical protein
MTDAEKETYPNIPAKHWWTLRERFQQSIPAAVTPRFLATVLEMQEKSAKANIMPSLVKMGIIDQEGKPTERATRWRDDVQYADVCREMRGELYPQELLDAASGPTIDRLAVERWFAATTGLGQAAVKRFALVYELLTSGTLPEKRRRSAAPADARPAGRRKSHTSTPQPSVIKQEQPLVPLDMLPSIHIDIQLHISPDAKPDQIDQIFASMAKHLRTRDD